MLNTDSRKLLYNAVIASRLNYCDVIWDNCNQTSCNKLQTVQNRCARTILNATPGASSGPLLNELGWLNLKEKRKLHKCVLMHELLLNKGPPALCNELIPFKNRGTYGTRGATNNNLFLPSHRTNYIGKSFYYETSKIWNNIPFNIRDIKNRNCFKESLHKYLINQRQQDRRS